MHKRFPKLESKLSLLISTGTRTLTSPENSSKLIVIVEREIPSVEIFVVTEKSASSSAAARLEKTATTKKTKNIFFIDYHSFPLTTTIPPIPARANLCIMSETPFKIFWHSPKFKESFGHDAQV